MLHPSSPTVSREELLQLHRLITEECRGIMERKNHDYTGAEHQDPFSNFRMAKTFGVDPVVGLVLRVGDKLQRVVSFVSKGELKVEDEGWKDALKDIVNYCILAYGMLLERERQDSLTES